MLLLRPASLLGSASLLLTAAVLLFALALTTNSPNQAGSAFHPTPVNIQSFTSTSAPLPSSNSGQAVADGLMFVIQNQSPSALGPAGQNLGFGGIKPSLGLKFDLYNDAGEGNNSTGIFLNGAAPTIPARISTHRRHQRHQPATPTSRSSHFLRARPKEKPETVDRAGRRHKKNARHGHGSRAKWVKIQVTRSSTVAPRT